MVDGHEGSSSDAPSRQPAADEELFAAFVAARESAMAADRPARRRLSRRARAWVAAMLVVVFLLSLAAGFSGYRYTHRLVSRGQQAVGGLHPVVKGKPENILLVGSDSREGLSAGELRRIQTAPEASQRTDTIILAHLSPGRAVLLSLPRDLKVAYGGETHKINAAIQGGPTRMVGVVEQATGLAVNHYVEVDFAGFVRVVDALGGITLCTPPGQRLDDALANLHMSPGCHHLGGLGALAFVRARHATPDGDFGRIRRQQQFLEAVMTKLSSRGNLIDLPRLARIADSVSHLVSSDDTLSTREALALLRRFGTLSRDAVDLRVLPSQARPPACQGCASFVYPLPEAVPLLRAIRADAPVLPRVGLGGGGNLTLSGLRVEVRGATSATAARAASRLRADGVRAVAAPGAAPAAARSSLAYPPPLTEQARLLGFLLGPAVALQPGAAGAGGRLVLVVGPRLYVPVYAPGGGPAPAPTAAVTG
jgi:LCP family protein required for cell wall assembly